jgi:predicted nuclease of predicted toxin-antitoxin system
MTEFVADESVDFNIVVELRKRGAQVYSISEAQPSLPDHAVLQIAVKEDCLLITEDKDFGELVFRLRFEHRGILLIRSQAEINAENIVNIILKYSGDLRNKFSVLTSDKLRIRD